MVGACSVYGCSTNSKKNRGLTFHGYPKNSDIRKIWVVKLRQGKAVSPHMKVCSLHFRETDFLKPQKPEAGITRNRFLKEGAYPTLNLPRASVTKISEDTGHAASRAIRKVLAPPECTTTDAENSDTLIKPNTIDVDYIKIVNSFSISDQMEFTPDQMDKPTKCENEENEESSELGTTAKRRKTYTLEITERKQESVMSSLFNYLLLECSRIQDQSILNNLKSKLFTLVMESVQLDNSKCKS